MKQALKCCHYCRHAGHPFRVLGRSYVHCEHPDPEIAGDPAGRNLRYSFGFCPAWEEPDDLDPGFWAHRRCDEPTPGDFPPDFSALVEGLRLAMRNLTAALEKLDGEKTTGAGNGNLSEAVKGMEKDERKVNGDG